MSDRERGYKERSHRRSRSRSRSRERSRSYRDGGSRDNRDRDRDRDRDRGSRDRDAVDGRSDRGGMPKFSSGGMINQDNGGMPLLLQLKQQQQLENQRYFQQQQQQVMHMPYQQQQPAEALQYQQQVQQPWAPFSSGPPHDLSTQLQPAVVAQGQTLVTGPNNQQYMVFYQPGSMMQVPAGSGSSIPDAAVLSHVPNPSQSMEQGQLQPAPSMPESAQQPMMPQQPWNPPAAQQPAMLWGNGSQVGDGMLQPVQQQQQPMWPPGSELPPGVLHHQQAAPDQQYIHPHPQQQAAYDAYGGMHHQVPGSGDMQQQGHDLRDQERQRQRSSPRDRSREGSYDGRYRRRYADHDADVSRRGRWGDGYDDRSDDDDRDNDRRRGSRHSRRSKYEADLEAGLDGHLERQASGHSASSSSDDESRREGGGRNRGDRDRERGGSWDRDRFQRRRERPSASVYVKGIPEDKEEADLYKLLEAFPNVKAIRLGRDRTTGLCKGFAFIDFETEHDAAALMETRARYSLQMGDARLYFEYTNSREGPSGGGAGGGPEAGGIGGGGGRADSLPMDWICAMCGAANFARRLECYQCSSVRPANPQRISIDPEGPSPILKVSGLEPMASEELLRSLFSAHTPVKDVRVVRDKYTGAPRGFAFVQYGSVAEAGKALQALQGITPDWNSTPLRLCYARDRAMPANTPAPASSLAADALGAAQAMQQYSGWEPKEFDEAAINGDVAAQQQQGASEPGSLPAGHANAGQQQQPGFVYDPATGYWYDANSGMYYDANTGLYYSPTAQQWMSYDQTTGQYTPVVGDTAPPSHASNPSTAVQGAIAATEAAVASISAAAAAPKPAPEARKGAVIGASARLNPQGLLAAVQQMEEKEAQQKALAAQKPAQLRKPAAKAATIAAAPSVTQAAAKAQAKPAAAASPAVKAVAAAGAAAAPAPAAAAPVQGVIHRGKWAQKKA